MQPKSCRIGTRGSALARFQAQRVKALIQAHNPSLQVELIIIQTEGDKDQVSPLAEIGGKSVFVKAIEQALIEKEIDIAVHSFKDITAESPKSLCLSGALEAEATEDALISLQHHSLGDLPIQARIGTSSLRRKAWLQQLFPNWQFHDIRGNVETRLEKTAEQIDAAIISKVALLRLNLIEHCLHTFSAQESLPAPGQGIIALQTRKKEKDIATLCHSISHLPTLAHTGIYWELMKALSFNCQIPLGAKIEGATLKCRIARPNGQILNLDQTLYPDPLEAVTKAARQAKEFYDGK